MDNIEGQMHKALRITDLLAGIRGCAWSDDCSVAIRTDYCGRITDLYLTAHALQYEPERLAAIIIECQGAALADAAMEAEQLLEQSPDQ
ncbi:hypothetical protein [Nocardia iowensis]|uniref:Uncharacterized protein n=1 Tax=Nocardia iowensis TaxID=204891 RepID=A0ABX8S232_NOCIO|nr:hypothetical protein [Nocardia iowensis]QXN94635.1 hypothetical protein KV110_17225 [Nocardia iowensis]